MRTLKMLFCIALAGGMQMASASSITTFSRATFEAAFAGGTLSGQNFDSLPLGDITTVNGVTFTPSMGIALVTDTYLTSTPPNGLGSTSAGFFEPDETLTIVFSSPITAFALDINTFATTPGAYQAAVNDGSGSAVPSIFDVFPNSTTGQFIGFTDTSPFTTAVISGLAGDSYTVDTLVYGNASAVVGAPVPEPSTFALLGLGISALGLLVRRRKIL